MNEKILTFSKSVKTYTIFDSIKEFDDYGDLLQDLYKAEEGEGINILLNSPGGRVDIGTSIINAMGRSKAAVNIIVDGPCYSMGAILALAGNSLSMEKDTFLMFHDYSSVSYGKGSEQELCLEANRKTWEKSFKRWCMPFLTLKECNKIIKGEDLYIYDTCNTLSDRIKRHFK